MAPTTRSFDLWSRAHEEANAAEQKVQQAALAFAYGKGEPPSDADIADALHKRVRALALFEQMLIEYRAIAQQASPGAPRPGAGAEVPAPRGQQSLLHQSLPPAAS